MRSVNKIPQTAVSAEAAASRFGALVSELATKAGYDLTPGGNGRARLAEVTGMSLSAVRRMLLGETLPLPQHYEPIAQAVGTPVRALLIEARVISARSWPEGANGALASHPDALDPEDAADALGLTDPAIRSMFLTTTRHAIQLQREISQRAEGGTAARG